MTVQPSGAAFMSREAQGAVARAYVAPAIDKRGGASRTTKVTLVALDCLFLGLQPVLVHLSKNTAGGYSYAPVAVNFLVEAAKSLFALVTLIVLGTGRQGPPMYRSLRSFVADAHHNRLLAVPAFFYAINNYLKFTMQLFFRPTTTKMLGNLKIFTIALLMRTVMKRQFNTIQWEALFLLVAGITVNQLAPTCGGAGGADAALPPLLPALLCTLGTVTVPSAASVYNEFALKRHMDTSVHLQNFFLYFYGLLFNLLAVVTVSLVKGMPLMTVFYGQTPVTLLLIANNAAQGILSSFFYKFADTILKKYSSTIATIFTAVMSFVMFGHPLTVNFMLGVSIVFISMHQFFTFGDKPVLADKDHPGGGSGGKSGSGLLRGGAGVSAPNARMLFSPSLEQITITSASAALGGGAGASGASAMNGYQGGLVRDRGSGPGTPSHHVGITIPSLSGSGAHIGGGKTDPDAHPVGLSTATSLRGVLVGELGSGQGGSGVMLTSKDSGRRLPASTLQR